MTRASRFAVLFLTLTVISAACSDAELPTSPSPDGDTVGYTVLGASDGLGVGGSIVCAPFDLGCENGTGYAQRLRRRFQSDGRTVLYANLSVPGYVLSRAIADLAAQTGRSDTPGAFLERYPGSIRPTTTHVTIFAGGNDANIIGNAVGAGLGGNDPRGFIDGQVRQWGADLAELVSRVRNRAPNARIVVFNLPNLAAAPYMTGRTVAEKSIMQRVTTGLADQANGLTGQGVLVLDMMCDPRVIQPSSFSGDGFHPSDAGYALMEQLAYPALSNGASPAPAPSCPNRTAFPPM